MWIEQNRTTEQKDMAEGAKTLADLHCKIPERLRNWKY